MLPALVSSPAAARRSAADERVVQPLGRWQRKAELIAVRVAEVIGRAGRWLHRDAEADDVAQMLALEEQLATTLVDQLGESTNGGLAARKTTTERRSALRISPRRRALRHCMCVSGIERAVLIVVIVLAAAEATAEPAAR